MSHGPPVPSPPRGPLPGPTIPVRVRRLRLLDLVFRLLTGTAGAAFLVVFGGVAVLLLANSISAFRTAGGGFLTGQVWNPNRNLFGALPAIEGTLITSLLALVLAVPIAVGVALFLSEFAPRALRVPLAYALDLGAGIPSVIYGIWAFVVLVPWLRGEGEPALSALTRGGFPFSGPIQGQDLLAGSLILAIMIIPTIAAVAREALRAVPRIQREAALGLGATRWEALRTAVLPPALPGIFGGVMLGLGRALGETMALLVVMSYVYQSPQSLFSPGATLASALANDFTSNFATNGSPELSALFALGLILLAITVLVNVLGRLLVRGFQFAKLRSRRAALPRRIPLGPEGTDRSRSVGQPVPDWLRQALSRAPAVRARRRWWERGVVGVLTVASVLAVLPLLDLFAVALARGGAELVRPAFYVSEFPIAPPPGQSGALGGIGPAIEGTLLLLGLAGAWALPVGVLAGVHAQEIGRGRRFSNALEFFSEVMTGVPTLLLGLFAFAVFFAFDRSLAVGVVVGGFALGVVMLPLVIRTTQGALRTVPLEVREAGLALGLPRGRLTLRITLGCARKPLTTGLLLALSRAAGDAAALLFTAGFASASFANSLSSPVAALPTFIWQDYDAPALVLQEAAWGAALVLLLFMLALHALAHLAGAGPMPGRFKQARSRT